MNSCRLIWESCDYTLIEVQVLAKQAHKFHSVRTQCAYEIP